MTNSFSERPIGELVKGKASTWSPRNEPSVLFDYIDISSVDRETKRISEPVRTEGAKAPSRARQLVRVNDILVSTVRPNLNAVGLVTDELDGATASTGFSVLRANDELLEPAYLFHWVRTAQFVKKMMERATGANYPAVSDRIVKESTIPLPPLSEQRRIAAILDKADAVRRKRAESLRLADDFLKAAFLDLFGDPITNAKNWPVKRLGEMIQSATGGWSAKGESRYRTANEYGVLKISSVTSGTYRPTEHKAVSTTVANGRSLIVPEVGDLLFSRANTRELVGATCIVDHHDPRLFLPDKLWRLEPQPNTALPEFLKLVLSHDEVRTQLANYATGTSGSMLNISKAKLMSFQVFQPDFALQKKFRDLYWKQQQLAQRLEPLALDNLFTSLVQRAFRGDL